MDHRSVLRRQALRQRTQGGSTQPPSSSKPVIPPVKARQTAPPPVRAPEPAPPDPSREFVSCEQAIFTSIRTRVSEGYRIVAASPGISQEQRRELMRRAPSHGGLCVTSADAVGLLYFPVCDEGFCICYCQNAGAEHTARGGQRVYTNAVILDTEAFAKFNFNPVRVHAAVGQVIGEPVTATPAYLHRLELPVPRGAASVDSPVTLKSPEALINLTATLLSDRETIVTGADATAETLQVAMDCLPISRRTQCSVSLGVTYAPTRHVMAALIDGDLEVARRATRGHTVCWLAADEVGELAAAGYEPWLLLVRKWIQHGRLANIATLTRRLGPAGNADTFNRAARLHQDFDRALTAKGAQRDELNEIYRHYSPQNDIERELVERIRQHTQRPVSPERSDTSSISRSPGSGV